MASLLDFTHVHVTDIIGSVGSNTVWIAILYIIMYMYMY